MIIFTRKEMGVFVKRKKEKKEEGIFYYGIKLKI